MQEEKEIAVLLGSFIVREEPFLRVCGIVEMAGDFILLDGKIIG